MRSIWSGHSPESRKAAAEYVCGRITPAFWYGYAGVGYAMLVYAEICRDACLEQSMARREREDCCHREQSHEVIPNADG